ncbi:MAG: DUF4905 domain-containing protein [Ignavibacteriaceae bacterium]
MNIKKQYLYDNDRQIWRIIPAGNRVIIEERSSENKEVFFNCIDIISGDEIFSDIQLNEKFWVGIEAVEDDFIFFHKFPKPDLPNHKSIITLDLNSSSVLWENDELTYFFYFDGKVVCYKQLFEKRDYFLLNAATGEVISELGDDHEKVMELREESIEDYFAEGYLFPVEFRKNVIPETDHEKYLYGYSQKNIIRGNISYIVVDGLLLFNYHEITEENLFNNTFIAVNLDSEKVLMKETLNKKINNLMPDSFFVRDDLLFLLFEKTKFGVYSITNQ